MGYAVAMAAGAMVGSVGHVFGAWGPPPDDAAKAALVAAGVLAVVACLPPRTLTRGHDASFDYACAFVAAALSLGYVAFYLLGGPRIVDATSYWLQARALSEGHFAWHVPSPDASFRGRFELARDGAVGGIFPPGYPLLLSLGFAVGAPMVVGPALAAAIVFATGALARSLARGVPDFDALRVAAIGRVASALSVVCAALRYHTADTMAHGACALAFAIALRAALRAGEPRRDEAADKPWFFLIAGAALGFVVATRFASALALGVVLAFAAWRSRARAASLVACALGAVPGLLLLAVAQRVVTGSAFASAQAAYYAASDGPPGCFRYGFGRGVGCLIEHGDFVRAGLVHGGSEAYFGFTAALLTTGRRLAYHLGDVANLEPLALLVVVPLFVTRARGVRLALGLVAAQVLAYAPFYFDGDYPGGGARFFADVLPVEHALVAVALAALAVRARVVVERAGAVAVGLALVGFGVHSAYAHDSLRDRDGGHPMFDHESLAKAHVANGSLVFVENDQAFALAHDPAAADHAARVKTIAGADLEAPVVARLRNDDLDRLLHERLGRPRAYVHRFRELPPASLGDLALGAAPATIDTLEPWNPILPAIVDTWRFESENEWPPLAQRGAAWAEPVWATGTCASDGRALAVHASGAGEVRIALPIPHGGAWQVTPRLFGAAAASGKAALVVGEPELARFEIPAALAKDACVDLPAREVLSNDPAVPVVLRCEGPCDFALDRIWLGKPGSPPPASPPRRIR